MVTLFGGTRANSPYILPHYNKNTIHKIPTINEFLAVITAHDFHFNKFAIILKAAK